MCDMVSGTMKCGKSKAYTTQYSGAIFRYPHEMKDHELQHTGEKPYMCLHPGWYGSQAATKQRVNFICISNRQRENLQTALQSQST